jgi:hypothetical protein
MKYGDWEVVGGIVQGATHIRREKPCQDALYIRPPEGERRYALACVADGHGSERCPYSAEGAKAAVEAAAAILSELLENGDPYPTLAAHKDIRLPRQIESKWKEAVREIHAGKAEGLCEDELIPFSYELYGTTLLALASAPDFVFALQIGDGDIVAIDPDGSARWLLPPGEHAGNETESLCMDASWQYIRTQLIPLNGTQSTGDPLMLMLSTDGYTNSFVDGAGFLKAGADIHRLWRMKGRGYIEENLSGWLAQTSADGSGDDIAVAVLARDEGNKTTLKASETNEAV